MKIWMNEDRYKIKQITNKVSFRFLHCSLCFVVLHFPGMEKGKLNFAHKRNVCSKKTSEENKADKGRKWMEAKEWRRNREKRKRKRKQKEKKKDVPFFSLFHSIPSFFFFLFFLIFFHPLSLTLSFSFSIEIFTDRRN